MAARSDLGSPLTEPGHFGGLGIPPGFTRPLILTRDLRRESRKERAKFARVRQAEHRYGVQLRAVARNIGMLVEGLAGEDPVGNSAKIKAALDRYSETLRSWAEATADRMLADVSRRDEAAWRQIGRQMGRSLREEIETAPTGELMRELLGLQVDLITSLPREAAQRVQKFTVEALEIGGRAKAASDEIMRSGEVARSRANLIARTETARAASTLVEARALHVGSEGYIWRTVGDADVRKEHRKLDGKFIRWDDPPVAGSSGERAHAGQIYNCRCWSEPVIPQE